VEVGERRASLCEDDAGNRSMGSSFWEMKNAGQSDCIYIACDVDARRLGHQLEVHLDFILLGERSAAEPLRATLRFPSPVVARRLRETSASSRRDWKVSTMPACLRYRWRSNGNLNARILMWHLPYSLCEQLLLLATGTLMASIRVREISDFKDGSFPFSNATIIGWGGP